MSRTKGFVHFIRRFIGKRLLGNRKYRRMEEFALRFPDTSIHWTCDIAKTGKVEIGFGTYFGENGRVLSWQHEDKVAIGKYCSIAGNVIIVNGGAHDLNSVSLYDPFNYLPVGEKENSRDGKGNSTIIGNDVWIATRATIVGPVNIGDGAAVAAGSVVTADVPPYTLVAGVPAKPVKQRATEKQVEVLRRIAWWNWSPDSISERLSDITGPIDAFLEKYGPDKE